MMHGNTITSTSTVHPSLPPFADIQGIITRNSALRKLPPLPTSESILAGLPLFTSQTTLPLLPEPPAPKPLLPPRPGTRPISSIGGDSVKLNTTTSSVSSSHSRISNPLASFQESTFHPRTWACTLTGIAACVGYGFVDGFNTGRCGCNGRSGGGSKKEKEKWDVNQMEAGQFEDTVDFVRVFTRSWRIMIYLRVELGGGSASVTGGRENRLESEVRIQSIKTRRTLQMDNSSHDSALLNRITALNLLDLTLEHLDIVTENESKAEVEDVKVCGVNAFTFISIL
ncbi:hypothetical protein D9756_011625 [Leucocoprinus leucothites]|uniref:Uncharacterized protein n=1 Tax=Leucocoprinus leucothites TaxID=201217 RepID=A0A8H5FP01_9AGAR|nr:hypothetical protein D9756_011625 [Leucoagaricus leucothites]